MVRPELHPGSRIPDVLAHPPGRPRFDAVAWRRAQANERAGAPTRPAECQIGAKTGPAPRAGAA
jgi:hypothetical protein